jgi:hypothetical protein
MKPEPPPFRIAKPCPKNWNEMSGDAKRRFCEHCQLHVHNLSAMSERERGEFVAESGGKACIAYELRGDGSMVTPSRWSWLFAPLRRFQQAGTALLAACLPMAFSACSTTRKTTLGAPLPPRASADSKSGMDSSTVSMGEMAPMDPLPPPAKKKH